MKIEAISKESLGEIICPYCQKDFFCKNVNQISMYVDKVITDKPKKQKKQMKQASAWRWDKQDAQLIQLFNGGIKPKKMSAILNRSIFAVRARIKLLRERGKIGYRNKMANADNLIAASL